MLLEALPIVLDGETGNRVVADIVQLARNHQLSAYDAAYLELAIRRGLPLACLDCKLKMAAATAGVVLFSCRVRRVFDDAPPRENRHQVRLRDAPYSTGTKPLCGGKDEGPARRRWTAATHATHTTKTVIAWV
ncbi:MAG: type II toxin-antitoxin system VapC family toxin [Isosphaeraceae bacterium]